jgi:hypothetical protein
MKVSESGQGSTGDPQHIPAPEPDQSGGGDPPSNGGRSAAIWAQIIGASTAVIALIVAIIYGLGAIYLGVKLWYTKDPYTPVLGQLPRNFLLVDAFIDVIIPAILAGAIAYLLYRLHEWLTRRSPIRKLRTLINSVVGVATLDWPGLDHPVIATAFRDGTVRVWDSRGPGRELARFDSYTYPVVGVARLDWPGLDHPVIATASCEGTVRVWDPHDPGQELACFDGHTGSNAIKKLARPLSLLALAALLAAVPIGFLRFFQTYATPHTLAGVIRPYWEIYLLCLILSILSIGLACVLSYILSKGRKHQQAIEVREHEDAKLKRESGGRRHRKVVRAGIVMGIAAVALIPCISFAAAAFPLPVVVLCGAQFSNIDTLGRHYVWGSLIGTSGQSVYVAVTRESSNLSGGNTVHYVGNYIAVIPLSAVQLETIGSKAECNYAFPAPASSQDPVAEANPTFAIDYAESSVGTCIYNAFSEAGYIKGPYQYNVYYVGDGVVVFETGTQSNPANLASSTLIDVQTYADGYVADNGALDHWGCQPSNGGLISGYYVNGQPGTPHWLIQLTTEPGGSISGTIVFVRQHRQTGLAQTFTGHAQSGLATLKFSQAGLQTAPYESGSISLGSCTAWLKYIPGTAACTFKHSSGFQ